MATIPTNAAQQYLEQLKTIRPTEPGGEPSLQDVLKGGTGAVSQVPGATTPVIRDPSLDALTGIRMPVAPRMRGDMPTQQVPWNDTVYAQRMTNQQNIFNQFSNMASHIANQKAQEKYRDAVATIKDYSGALVHRQEAQRVLQDPTSSAQAKQEAQGVLDESGRVIDKIQKDNKQWRIIEKAMPNYIDPEQNQTMEVRAGQDANKQVAQADSQNLNNETQAQANVSAASDRIQGIGIGTGQQPQTGRRPLPVPQGIGGPVPTQAARREAGQPLVTLPQGLIENPAFAEQQKFQEKLTTGYNQYVLPRIIQERGQDFRRLSQDWTNLEKERMHDLTTIYGDDERAKTAAMTQQMMTDRDVLKAKIKAEGLTGLGGVAGPLASRQIKDNTAAINNLSLANERSAATITKLEGEVDAIKDPDKEKERVSELRDLIRREKAKMRANDENAEEYRSLNKKLMGIPGSAGGGASFTGPATAGADIPDAIAPARPGGRITATYKGQSVTIDPKTGDAFDSAGKKVGNIHDKPSAAAGGPQPVGPPDDSDEDSIIEQGTYSGR
jgi:hypothetical protein